MKNLKPEDNKFHKGNGEDQKHTPKIGDSVAARRKPKSKLYHNLVIGPVVDVWDNACRVITNSGDDIEGDFRLCFNEWDFQFLHLTKENS